MRRSIPLQKECLPSIYTYLIDKECKIYSTCTCTCTSYRKHSQFRPKLHTCVSMLVCMCWCVLYIYVCKWTQQTARTHAWDARTHAIYMYTWLTEPLPDARQLPVARGRKKTPLYLGRYLHARISPLDTLYIYGDSHTSEAEHKQADRQGRPV